MLRMPTSSNARARGYRISQTFKAGCGMSTNFRPTLMACRYLFSGSRSFSWLGQCRWCYDEVLAGMIDCHDLAINHGMSLTSWQLVFGASTGMLVMCLLFVHALGSQHSAVLRLMVLHGQCLNSDSCMAGSCRSKIPSI